MFDEMLAIKKFRENQAELMLMRQRQQRDNALTKAKEAREKFKQYQEYFQEKEADLYSNLTSRVVRPRDIEYVLLEVAEMRVNQGGYATELSCANDVVAEENEQLRQRRSDHESAMKITKKFTEVVDMYQGVLLQIRARSEDNELEEIAGIQKRNSNYFYDESEPL